MNYRRLGRSGLQVSELSLGSVGHVPQPGRRGAAREMMAAAYDAGRQLLRQRRGLCDGPQRRGDGRGAARAEVAAPDYLVSTKFFWGLDREGNTVNRSDTLNRKYLSRPSTAR
jgi:hypothetical protein